MSTLDFRKLPSDRLATTDEVGRRMWIVPARVRGVWKNRKTLFHMLLLAILIITPWLRWRGEPVVLLNIADRQFIFFGAVYSAHDGPMIFFILGILTIGLALVTAVWGRVWCGWACPQTVFIEQVFRRIESMVIGNRAEQLACYANPDKPRHLLKILIKWLLFFWVSTIIAHSLIAYFVSWEKLLFMMQRPPGESWTVFLIMAVITLVLAFDFGWFREQFCIIMCPYGRFQSVLMDKFSLTVAYDHHRGEKRSKAFKNPQPGDGDCIDCYKCVSVCPTGIDIRNGQQLECIGCTACIDACDEVMAKLQKPKGLIRYASLAEIEGQKQYWLRPRVLGYVVILLLILAGFVYTVLNHTELYFSILRRNERPYSVVDEGQGQFVLNNYRLHLRNPNRDAVQVTASLSGVPVEMAPPQLQAELAAGESRYMPFFVKFKGEELQELSQKPIQLQLHYRMGGEDKTIAVPLKVVGPKSLIR